MLFRWLPCISLVVGGCAVQSDGSMAASTVVIDQPPETISTRGVDCMRDSGSQQAQPMTRPEPEGLRDDAQRMFNDLLNSARDELQLPDELTVTNADCGVQNASYNAEEKLIVLCNELFSNVAALWFDPGRSETENRRRILGAWRFVFFHELGHALVDIFDLPIEDEEDAVDDFSTLKLIEAGLAEDALSAAGFWHNKSKAGVPCTEFSDEHSLSEERFQAILCLVYGSNPGQLDQLVAQYALPTQQLCLCPAEFAKESARWQQLLESTSTPLCGYVQTACCEDGYACQPGLTCYAGTCSAPKCE